MADEALSEQEINAIEAVIRSYGLSELWTGVQDYIARGYTDANDILQMVSNDPNYQETFYRRFPAIKAIREENQRRVNTGQVPIPEITPAAYVSNEFAYAEATRNLPTNVATKDNITAWITNNVSPTEVQSRIEVARDYIFADGNAEVRAQLRDIYGLNDSQMVDYVLADPRRQEELQAEFSRNMRRANVGAQAVSRGFELSRGLRDEIADQGSGYTMGDTASRFASVESEQDTYAKLSAISGINTSRDDLIREEFDLAGGTSTTKVKRRLASQERARFGGSSAIGNNSLSVGGLGTQ